MKNKLLCLTLLSCCLLGCNNNSNNKQFNTDETEIPEVFKNTNFCNAAVEYYSGGLALIFDNDLQADIQNISFEMEIYSIEFERLPSWKKGNMYFYPFRVTDQIIDDGYLKNNTEYKFWLSYENSTYFCGISLNDVTLTEPTATLMEGMM